MSILVRTIHACTSAGTRWRHRVLEASDVRCILLELIATPNYIPLASLALLPKRARFNHISAGLFLPTINTIDLL